MIEKKIQILHFINLVGWSDLLNIMKEDLSNSNIVQKFYCDTISLQILCKIYGFNVLRLNGPEALKIVEAEGDVEYLVSKAVKFRAIVLPMLACKKSLHKFVNSYSINNSNIIIAISSPRQNYLALEIAKKNQNLVNTKIWCLGASVYNKNKIIYTSFRLFGFVIFSPIRTTKKIISTIKEILNIFLLKGKEFKSFCDYLEKNKM